MMPAEQSVSQTHPAPHPTDKPDGRADLTAEFLDEAEDILTDAPFNWPPDRARSYAADLLESAGGDPATNDAASLIEADREYWDA